MVRKPPVRVPKPKVEKAKPRRRRCALARCKCLFDPKRPWQRFCTPEHKKEFHSTSEDYGKLHDDVVKLVKQEVLKMVPQVARAVFLLLETEPPPALIARVSDKLRSEVLK